MPDQSIDANAIIADILSKASPETAAAFLKKLKIKAPQASTYYNERAAKGMQRVADEMIEDTERYDRLFKYEEYPEFAPTTLRQKLFGAVKYLVDTGGPKYQKWREEIKISIEDAGVRLAFKFNQQAKDVLFSAHRIKPESHGAELSIVQINWKQRILDLSESIADGGFEEIKDLRLDDGDKQWIKNFFGELEDFTVIVKTDSVRLIRKLIDGNEERIKIE